MNGRRWNRRRRHCYLPNWFEMIVTGVGADQASPPANPFTDIETSGDRSHYRRRRASLIASYRDLVPSKSSCDQGSYPSKASSGHKKQVIQNLPSLLHEGCRSRNPIVVGSSSLWSSQHRRMSLPTGGGTSRLAPISADVNGDGQQDSVLLRESLWSPSVHNNHREEVEGIKSAASRIIVQPPTDGSDVGKAGNSVDPGDCISTRSFERRRSLYEQQQQRLLQQHQLQLELQNGRASRLNSNEANLSLDQILADIQDGKLPASTIESIALPIDETHFRMQPYDDDYKEDGSTDNSDKAAAPSGDGMTEIDLSGAADRYEHQLQREHEALAGFEIAWLEFTYSVGPNLLEDPRWGSINKMFHKEHRMILKGLSGGLKSGQMVALMGPSGAGKTCLLECISGVRVAGIGGRLCLRGRKQVKLVIVPQYDDFMPQFTVEEIIMFGSKMKNPQCANHAQIVDKIIEQLGLKGCRKNNIKNCSGGQQKRVAIAQELVSRPNILVLDEPTSGLDSSCCYQTMKVLRDVLDESVKGEQPMAIVSTIHQPSAKVFKMFDLVYLLSKRGMIAYSGPPIQLLDTIKHVTGLECPRYSNPADYMIELVAYDYGTEPVDLLIEFEKEKGRKFVCQFDQRSRADSATGASGYNNNNDSEEDEPQHVGTRKASETRQQLANGIVAFPKRKSVQLQPSKSDTHLARLASQPAKVSHLLETANARQHVQYQNGVTVELRKATQGSGQTSYPFFWHTWLHLHRSFFQAVRDPILNNMRILIHLGFAILLVMLYGRKSGEARGCPPVLGLPREITDPNNEIMIDLADNIGYLFMCIMMITYVSLMSMVLTFPIDIKTVGKEYKNGWYGTVTYFLGKTIADLPFIVVYPLVYSLITWYVTNQAQDKFWRFGSFTLLIIMNAMNSQSFGLILGALFVNSVTAATFLGPVITIPWYLFTGFTKRIHRLAEPFKTASRFLFTRHIFEGVLDTVYGHQRCNCSAFLEEYNQLRFDEAMRLGQLISVETLSSLDYYDDLNNLDAYNGIEANATGTRGLIGGNWLTKTVNAAKNVFAASDELDLASLMESNVRSSSLFSFGLDFEPTCPSDYDNFIVQDFRLDDKTNERGLIYTALALTIIRVLTFVVVTWKIRTRQL